MKYDKRGVSADKKDVHAAISNLDKGLFPDAFCKILPDFITNDPEYATIMHADTAGTKTSLAYLYWKETADLSVWESIVQDAVVMNLDDMACTGVVDNMILSSTIGRNKNLISGEVIKTLIQAGQKLAEKFKSLGINIHLAGGETADVGDIVRTIDVGFTAFARIKRSDVIRISPQPGDIIIGFESYGKATYEEDYNSGIGSNGLTFARHEVLSKDYAIKYPESFDPLIESEYVYSGKMSLTDQSRIANRNIGQLLLSPTRTYLPLISKILKEIKSGIHGIVHCTGGGQTKILHFVDNLHIIKDNLIAVPPVFIHIQEQSNADWQEMFKVFNMGQRLEIYTSEHNKQKIINIASEFDIHAQQTGYVESYEGKKLTISNSGDIYTY